LIRPLRRHKILIILTKGNDYKSALIIRAPVVQGFFFTGFINVSDVGDFIKARFYMNNVTTRKNADMSRQKLIAIIIAIILTLLGFLTAWFLLSSGILRLDSL
jgi:uncharacterized membrane protein